MDVSYAFLISIGAVVLLGIVLLLMSGMVRYIPNTRVGIAEKLWSSTGSVKQGLIALHGEAGFQPDTLRGGFHFFFPFQYRLHSVPLVTISQGKIGYIFARDGKTLAPSQTLAANNVADNFEDLRAFLQLGGQKGPQRKILREGTYALNLAQFVVLTSEGNLTLNLDKAEHVLFEEMTKVIHERNGFVPVVIKDEGDKVGVVTTHDGPSLPPGEIIAPTVGEESPAVPPLRQHARSADGDDALLQGGRRADRRRVTLREVTSS